jgi:glutamine amidotransferase
MIIINNGLGNLASIHNILKQIGIDAEISNDYDKISKAKKIILPGVGNFKIGMECLHENKLDLAILNAAKNNSIILGICLGMHFLFEESEEGNTKGLGLIKGKVVKFNAKNDSLRIPHMGWNYVNFNKKSKLNFKEDEKIKFYFAHSYYAKCEDIGDIAATTNYGENFISAVQKKNICGVQFHPEKSHKFGKNFFKNFFTVNNEY